MGKSTRRVSLSPPLNSSIQIAFNNLSVIASTSASVAFSLAKIILAFSKASLNSLTTAGTTPSNAPSAFTFSAYSIVYCSNDLSIVFSSSSLDIAIVYLTSFNPSSDVITTSISSLPLIA